MEAGGMMDPIVHELKCLIPYFQAVLAGRKPFELRRNDRHFREGDHLLLREYTSSSGYTGREVEVEIGYILASGEVPGLVPGFVVLGLKGAVARTMPITINISFHQRSGANG